ncbi:hypothetical protein ABIB82_007790 [Bradyrhizobium sp. i1.8.4]|uniref:hypothetical protein n=1 Tax=unclassified Bradyrhizobium TaxID=2631580 RepID=UPI003D211F3C
MQTELNKVIAAVGEFYAQEMFLLERDLGERTLTHRLAVYVEQQFSGWQVDCNYDRLGERTLRLPRGSTISTDDHLGKSIYPDIVVHQRDIPNNLLAIELRKESNHQPVEHDQRKLQALTDPNVWFAYAMGVLVIFSPSGVSFSEVYAGGALESAASRWFAERLRESGLAARRDDGAQH